MTRLHTVTGVTVVVCVAAVFSNAEENARKSGIVTFESVQQNKDYRVTLLGVTKGIAFVDSQDLIGGGGRPPGKHAVPWMRVMTVIERLTDKNEAISCEVETADGKELVDTVAIKTNGHVLTSRASGHAHMDCDSQMLPATTFPVRIPEGVNAKTSKVHAFTLSGRLQPSTAIVVRLSFGNSKDRPELVFKNVPLP